MATTDSKKSRWWIWIVCVVILGVLAAGVMLIHRRSRTLHIRLYKKGVLFRTKGKTAEALVQFRAAIERKPDFLEAQISVIRTLTARKEFAQAAEEIKKAVEMGLDESEAAMLEARIMSLRGAYRLQSAGRAADPSLCEAVVKEDLDPAIALVRDNVGHIKKPAEGYNFLGGLYAQEFRVIATQQQLLGDQAREAQKLNHPQEATEKKSQALALTPDRRAAERASLTAYARAMKEDPEAERPRLATAQHLLSLFVPRIREARAVIEPLLKREPPDPGALRLTATAERLAGDHDAALRNIELLRKAQGDDPSMLLFEAETLLKAERLDEALAVVEKLIKMQPNDLRSAYVKGRILLEKDRPAEAVDCLQNIFALESRRWAQARFALAQALAKHGKREQAVTAYRETIEDVKESLIPNLKTQLELRQIRYDASLALARELQGELPESAAQFARDALLIAPHKAEALQVAREAYAAAGKQQQIEALVAMHAAASAIRSGPDAGITAIDKEGEALADMPRVQLLKSQLLTRKGSYREAADVLVKLRKSFPGNRSYAHALADLHRRLGHTDQARTVYEELVKTDPTDLRAMTGVVDALVRQGDMDGARQRLAHAEEQLGADQVRSLLIRLHLREGRAEDAISLAKAQAKANPKSPMAQALLAELLWNHGDLAGARVAFDNALELNPNYLPAYHRGLLDLEEQRASDAVSLFQSVTKRNRKHLDGWLNLAIALHADGKPQEALAVFQKLGIPKARRTLRLDTPRWILAVLHASVGDLEAALKQNRLTLGSEYGLAEERQRLLERLAGTDEPARSKAGVALNLMSAFGAGGYLHAALNALETAKKHLPGEPLPACWATRILDQQGKHDAAVAQFKEIIEKNPESVQPRLFLAKSYAANGQLEAAINTLQETLEVASPEFAPAIHLSLGRFHEQAGSLDTAISHYKQAMAQPRLTAIATNNIAWLLATEKGNPSEALPFAQRAAELASRIPAILDTAGWVYYLNGDTPKAVEYLEKARMGLPSNPTVRYHLGAAYLKAGRQAEAVAELQEALGLSKSFPEADAVRAMLKQAGAG